MKKFFALMLAMVVSFGTVAYGADISKQLKKAQDKQRKEKLKQYKKEKWTIVGSTNTIEVALLTHWDKLEKAGEDAHEVVGTASNFKSKNVGIQSSENNAAINYAKEAGSELRGRIATDLFGSGSDPDGEFDHFYQAFERGVQQEIKGELKKSFSIIHNNGNGTYEMESYFIVNESAAQQARMRALESALKESEIAQKHADKISDFVKQGINNK